MGVTVTTADNGVKVITVQVPGTSPAVFTVQVPGLQGPMASLTLGTVTTVSSTTAASATITGLVPNQVLNLSLPRGYGLIPGGATGQVLMKNSGTDYDTVWASGSSAPTAGSLMQRDASGRAQAADPSVNADIATKNYVDNAAGTSAGTNNALMRRDGTNGVNVGSVYLANQPTATNHATRKDYVDGKTSAVTVTTIPTTAYTLTAADVGTRMRTGSSAAYTITIPSDTAAAIPAGSWVEFDNYNASSTITFQNDGTSQVWSPGNLALKISTVDGVVRVTKLMSNYWQLGGLLDVGTPTASYQTANKSYVDSQDATYRRVSAVNIATPSRTFALTDEGQCFFYNADTQAVVYTIPTNATVAFPIGAWFDIYQGNTGATSIVGASGVSVRGPDGTSSIAMRGLYSRARIIKVATDSWTVIGDVQNVSTTATTNATSSPTIGTLVKRDANGRAQVVDPAASADIATKNYVDSSAASQGVAAATNAPTVSTIVKRDASGRAQVVDPAAAADIATKNYVDAGDANAAGHPVSVWNSTNTATTYNGQWFKIGSVNVTSQFSDYTLSFLLTELASGATTPQTAHLLWHVKQQAALGSAPLVSITVSEVTANGTVTWGAGQFMAINETLSSSQSVVSLWVQNNDTFSVLYGYEEYSKGNMGSGTTVPVFTYNGSPATAVATASLPAGTQTVGTAVAPTNSAVNLVVQSTAPANPSSGSGKLYLDSTNRATILGSSGTPRMAQYSWGSGTAFPTVANMAGDTFLRTDIGTNGTIYQYTGSTAIGSSGWITEGPIVCTSTTRPSSGLYAGVQALETDTGRTTYYTGSVWRLTKPELLSNADNLANTYSNAAWAGTTYGYVAGLGAKITVPADGITRTITFVAGADIAGDGWLVLRRDLGATPTTTWFPNSAGLRSSASTEDRMTFTGGETLDGTQQAVYYLNAKATVASGPSFYVPLLLLEAK